MGKIALWLVLVYGGHTAGTWGPLPYGMDQCEQRRDVLTREAARIVMTGKSSTGEVIPESNVKQIAAMRFTCEYRIGRPQLGEHHE